MSFHGEKGRSLGYHFANSAGGNSVTLENGEGCIGRFWGNGHEQAA